MKSLVRALAALGLAAWCGQAHAGFYTCNGQVVTSSMCRNGEPSIYHSGEPPSAPAAAPQSRVADAGAQAPGGGTARGLPLCSDPSAFAYKSGHYTCEGRPAMASTCPNGEPAVYHAEIVQACQATPVRHVSREEMARMNQTLDARAREIARQWTRSGRLNAAQIQAMRTGNCLIMGASNPDVTCVLGTPF